MTDKNLTVQDKQLAEFLRNEILKNSINEVKPMPTKTDFSGIELISENSKPYISPIMTMNEDEILDFVEGHEVNELAKLSDVELNRINEVLGVNPMTLIEKES